MGKIDYQDNDDRHLGIMDPRLAEMVRSVLNQVNRSPLKPAEFTLHIFCSERTQKQQDENVRMGVSKTFNSKHCLKPPQAADLVPVDGTGWTWDKKFPFWLIGLYAEANGLRWGGRFDLAGTDRTATPSAGMKLGWDPGHVELP